MPSQEYYVTKVINVKKLNKMCVPKNNKKGQKQALIELWQNFSFIFITKYRGRP